MALVAILSLASQVNAGEAPPLKTQKDKVSYIIGLDIGKNLQRQAIEVDPEIVTQGIKDAISGGKTALSEEEIKETMTAFQKEMMAKQQAINKTVGEKNKREGEAFLAENKGKEGVKTLPSGLQYKSLKEGSGRTPQATDTVTVQHRGTLTDGTEFDSSYSRGKPESFPVNRVIPGWSEALQHMKEGSKWQLFIPPELGYGERGQGPIPPNSVLVFEVELHSVGESAAPQAANKPAKPATVKKTK